MGTMTTTISLQEETKKQLDTVLNTEGHTSQDSTIKSLLLYRELYLQTQSGTPEFNPTTNTTTTTPTHHTAPGHKAYLGKIGSGKTVTVKYHIHHSLQTEDGNNTIIIDPLNSYEKFTAQHNGTTIDATTILNDNYTAPPTGNETHTALKNNTVPQLTPNNKPITEFDTPLLTITNIGTRSQSGNTFHDVLGVTISAIAYAAQQDTTTDVYIEESHYLLTTSQSQDILNTLIHYASEHNVNIHFISQTIREFMTEDTTTSLLDRIQTVFLHRLELNDDVQHEIGLSNGEAAYIRNAHTGTTEPYSEILIGHNQTWTPQRIELSKDFQKLIDA